MHVPCSPLTDARIQWEWRAIMLWMLYRIGYFYLVSFFIFETALLYDNLAALVYNPTNLCIHKNSFNIDEWLHILLLIFYPCANKFRISHLFKSEQFSFSSSKKERKKNDATKKTKNSAPYLFYAYTQWKQWLIRMPLTFAFNRCPIRLLA